MSTQPKPRSYAELTGEIAAGAQRVSIATRSWGQILPKPAAIDEAQSALTGLQRTMNELRSRMEAETSH